MRIYFSVSCPQGDKRTICPLHKSLALPLRRFRLMLLCVLHINHKHIYRIRTRTQQYVIGKSKCEWMSPLQQITIAFYDFENTEFGCSSTGQMWLQQWESIKICSHCELVANVVRRKSLKYQAQRIMLEMFICHFISTIQQYYTLTTWNIH